MCKKYVFPAVLKKEDCGYSVVFPDVEGCATSGRTLGEALSMAEDALTLMLYDKEECGETIPAPTDIRDIVCEEGEFVALIEYLADSMAYRKKHRVVKKTLTIPGWLNDLAEEKGINFSQVLHDAIKRELGISDSN